MSKDTDTYHHGDLRLALIEAGARAADDGGVDAIRVNVLAKQLGVSSGAPFRHFANRRALLVAIAEEAARRQLTAMAQAAVGQVDPLEAQRAMAIAYVRWSVAHPGFFRVLSRRDSLKASAALRAQSQMHLSQMDEAFASNRADPDARLLTGASAAVLAARSMVYGLARMCVDGLLGDDIDPDTAARLAAEVTEVLGRGLRTPGDTA